MILNIFVYCLFEKESVFMGEEGGTEGETLRLQTEPGLSL